MGKNQLVTYYGSEVCSGACGRSIHAAAREHSVGAVFGHNDGDVFIVLVHNPNTWRNAFGSANDPANSSLR